MRNVGSEVSGNGNKIYECDRLRRLCEKCKGSWIAFCSFNATTEWMRTVGPVLFIIRLPSKQSCNSQEQLLRNTGSAANLYENQGFGGVCSELFG